MRQCAWHKLVLVLVGVAVLATASAASALTIVRQFIPSGMTVDLDTPIGPLPVTTTGAPAMSAGGGNLIDIFNTAANSWEAAIHDVHTLTISFGWADLNFLGPDALGVAFSLAAIKSNVTLLVGAVG